MQDPPHSKDRQAGRRALADQALARKEDMLCSLVPGCGTQGHCVEEQCLPVLR